MTTVYVVTAGSGDSYRIERVYLDGDAGLRVRAGLQRHRAGGTGPGRGMAGPVPRRPPTTAPTGARSGGHESRSASVRGALRHTDEGERFDDFAIRQEWWTGDALPEAKVVRREMAGVPKIEVVGPVQGEGGGDLLGRGYPGQRRAGRSTQGNSFRYLCGGWKEMGMATRHCRSACVMIGSMDRHALERLGHHVVSRRVALGYRNRTDLADSLQFTVRTLADIEHGVRKASPGTYAMLENKLAWAPGSIDTILAGGEPNETVVKLRRTTPDRLSHAATDALSRASTEELLLELRRRIITPREAREVWEDWGGLNPRGDWPEQG